MAGRRDKRRGVAHANGLRTGARGRMLEGRRAGAAIV
jgi:hypothetical protein